MSEAINPLELHSTCCAICNTEKNAIELYPAKLASEDFHPGIFSARRIPDQIHYRIVKCNHCGLVRSDPTAAPELAAKLYAQSSMNYGDEIDNLKMTYGNYLAKLDHYGVKKGVMLEIGCGNGFFLHEAIRQGYSKVQGVEPSLQAIDCSDPVLKPNILPGTMSPGLFNQNQFDLICMFQVLDHIPDPGALLRDCHYVLKPGGLILCLNHNISALSARLFRSHSPIIDIEHLYLFAPHTIRRLFLAHQFHVLEEGSAFNYYSLRYIAQLLPLPISIKKGALRFLKNSKVGNLRLWLPLGNLYLVAQKTGGADFQGAEASI